MGRVPPGALQNGTYLKYASDTSRFSVNRYQPRLFVTKRKTARDALRLCVEAIKGGSIHPSLDLLEADPAVCEGSHSARGIAH